MIYVINQINSKQEEMIMTSPDITDIVKAVESDPKAFAKDIAGRIARSKDADSVCMMGGWTQS